jgi:hypothetical protein
MFTKEEIIEMLINQYKTTEKIHDFMKNKMLTWNDEKLIAEFKTACNGTLKRISHNQYIILN